LLSIFSGSPRSRHLSRVLLGLACTVWPVATLAQQSSAPAPAAADAGLADPLARQLKLTGDTAMNALRYEEALSYYERATAIEAHPLLLFNRARALQALHRYPEALEHFEEFKRQASPELLARAGQLDELIERLRSQVGRLEIVCQTPGATILVRGLKVGETPLSGAVPLNAGPAHISVLADGFFPYETDVVLTGGATEQLAVSLSSKKSHGRVMFRSAVRGAVVFVDGERLGVVPAESSLVAGRHRVSLRHPDFKPSETTFVIGDGEAKVVALELERKPGIFQTWWFWTGASVVVASGVALTVALTTERKADRGSIAPGVVSAPLTRF
jgi:hypothetical protein